MFFTEILDTNDPSASNLKIIEAKRQEISFILKRGTSKIVLRSEIPNDANKLSCRYVLAIKDPGSDLEKYHTRFIFGGHRDVELDTMVRSSTTMQQQSFRMLFGWRSCTQDFFRRSCKLLGSYREKHRLQNLVTSLN